MADQIDFLEDVIDVRDIIARFEELEDDMENIEFSAADQDVIAKALEAWRESDDGQEHAKLEALLEELAQCDGGDEQWRGDWYPATLIADRYFVEYTREMLEDCGEIPRDLPHYIEIDWQATARNVQLDYTPVEIDSPKHPRKLTFWTR